MYCPGCRMRPDSLLASFLLLRANVLACAFLTWRATYLSLLEVTGRKRIIASLTKVCDLSRPLCHRWTAIMEVYIRPQWLGFWFSIGSGWEWVLPFLRAAFLWGKLGSWATKPVFWLVSPGNGWRKLVATFLLLHCGPAAGNIKADVSPCISPIITCICDPMWGRDGTEWYSLEGSQVLAWWANSRCYSFSELQFLHLFNSHPYFYCRISGRIQWHYFCKAHVTAYRTF